ncbi:MAG: carbohydrate-binding domain-containing protein [Ruminococcus sp.]|nr:carbohydrate-binding domain-containing protein [Ruminococcus sp.]
MNYRKIIAWAAVFTMLAAFTGCGKEEASETFEDITSVSVVSDQEETSASDETSEITKTAETETKKSSETSKAVKTEVKSDKKTTAKAEVTSVVKTSNSGESSSSGGSENSGNNGSPENNQQPVSTKSPESPQIPTVTMTDVPEKTYDAEITFDETVSADGVNVRTDGSVVSITAGGDYIVRGSSSNGQIYVDTAAEEKVEITLDNIDISYGEGPAILINEAKKCVIKLADGSVNYLRDGGNDKVNDGVIFSNDTLRIKGGGYLEINAGNAHGIASDDDVIIESGEYLINSIKSGIFAHDDITVNGGELTIFGGTNGIKSKGTVNINGGTSLVCGGVKEEKSSVYAAAGLYYRGGCLYAAGNAVTPPSETPDPYIVVNWTKGAAADSTVGFVLGGTEFASLTPKNPFKCVMMLAPDILIGDVFTPVLDGEGQGDFTVEEGQNLYVID